MPKSIEKLGNVFKMYRHRINTNVHSLDRKHIYYLFIPYLLIFPLLSSGTSRHGSRERTSSTLVHDVLRATIDGIDLIRHNTLGGGFKHCLFSPLLGKMIQFDEHIFRWVGSTTNQHILNPQKYQHLQRGAN